MKERVGTTILAGSLLLGAADAPPNTELTTAQAEQLLVQQEVRLKDFWATKGLGIEATRLVLVRDQQTEDCVTPVNGTPKKLEVVGNLPDGEFYCDTDDKIIITDGDIRFVKQLALGSDFSEADALEIIAAHETGHAVQKRVYTTVGRTTEIELQADCLAGKSLAAVNPAALTGVRALFTAFGRDFGHGTITARVGKFKEGAVAGNCL